LGKVAPLELDGGTVMKRGGVSALVLALAVAGGCQSPAKYVEKRGDAGIVAIPANTDTWPTHNRREALALIQKHVGSNYEILEEREVVVGQATRNDQQVNTEQTVNRELFFLPAEKQTTTTTTTQRDITEWRIVYRRVDPLTPRSLASQQPANPVGPAGGVAPGLVPNVGPNVQPAGAVVPRGPTVVPRGTTGTGSYLMPGARPANPADCNH
jgi:hypothetical protein